MADKKNQVSAVFVLLTLGLIFSFKFLQESNEFEAPLPKRFVTEHSVPVQKMNINISKAPQKLVSNILTSSKHVDNIIPKNMPENESTLDDEPKRKENRNMETAFYVTSRVENSKVAHRFVSNVSTPSIEEHSPNSREDEKKIDVKNLPRNRTTVEESRLNKSLNSKVFFNDSSGGTLKKPCIKQIQVWADFKFEQFSEKEYSCPEENCRARVVHSSSYEKLKTSHAVILHHRGSWIWEDVVRSRPIGQLWIYMSKESSHVRRLSVHDHRIAFNCSMTYHSKSDFVIPYGRYIEGIPEIHANDNRNWASGKTRLIAWMASNCGATTWPRMKFVQDLERLIQIDTYGNCGRLECPLRDEKCVKILSSHKFYLSLENSECPDYITEKFWKNALANHVVPIVYGTTRKDYEKVAPPNSFIHLSDFRNMTSLVDYIKYLNSNDTAYNEYFEWRKRGSTAWYSERKVPSPEGLLCLIVKKLKNIDYKNTKETKVEPQVGIDNWWKETLCRHRKKGVWA